MRIGRWIGLAACVALPACAVEAENPYSNLASGYGGYAGPGHVGPVYGSFGYLEPVGPGGYWRGRYFRDRAFRDQELHQAWRAREHGGFPPGGPGRFEHGHFGPPHPPPGRPFPGGPPPMPHPHR